MRSSSLATEAAMVMAPIMSAGLESLASAALCSSLSPNLPTANAR